MAKIVTIDGIPVYQALVEAEGDTGMVRISLVDDPAVQSDFLAFKNQEQERKVLSYAVQDEDKHLVLGVVMRADFPIYRRDADGFEYYIIYKADTIRTMAEKYLAENRQNIVSLMHQDGSDVEGVQMVQYFIKGKGLEPEGFEGIADGSLFAEFHVENEEIWQAIKEGTYKGFSLEGIFDLVPEHDAEDVQRIVDTLEGKFKTILKNTNMAKLKGLLARLAKAIVSLGNITTDKGILSWDGEEDLKAGDSVFIEDTEGNREAASDGEYVTEDGKTIVVVDGKVSEIRDPKAEVAPAEPEENASTVKAVQTDKGKLEWDNEDEDLKEGDAVYITDEEGNRNPAPDGDYTTEDGKVITVKDGKVSSIVDPNAEVDAAKKRTGCMARIAQAFSESYDTKRKKIYEAIHALGYDPYGWLADCGDDFAVYETYDENYDSHYTRFAISWDTEGNAVASNPVEVVPAFVTKEERDAADAAFSAVKTEKEELAAQVKTLTAELAAIKKAPAGKPAHEEFANQGEKTAKTGSRGIDRLAELMDA